MTAVFLDSRKRIDRAMVHAKAFTSEWTSLADPANFETRIEQRDAETFVVIGGLAHAPRYDLALILGEFFYQLRAALDALIYRAMGIDSLPNDATDESRIEFPIYHNDDRKFERSAVNKGPFARELKDWLKSIQPYNAAHSSDPSTMELGRRLSILHDCARKDRHRRLHVVAAVPTSVE